MIKYLQKAWGDSIDDVSMPDIITAIAETQQMDDEHGAFWVGTEEEEIILETNKWLQMICVVENTELSYKAANWQEVEELYQLLLNEDFEALKKIITSGK